MPFTDDDLKQMKERPLSPDGYMISGLTLLALLTRLEAAEALVPLLEEYLRVNSRSWNSGKGRVALKAWRKAAAKP